VSKLKHLKVFEDFKQNNITIEDIIKCIDNDGFLETDIVKNLPDNPDTSIRPVSVEDNGEITVEIDGSLYEVDLKNVKKITY
jgi:hypothetical protein